MMSPSRGDAAKVPGGSALFSAQHREEGSAVSLEFVSKERFDASSYY
jgi:hypothetical protein